MTNQTQPHTRPRKTLLGNIAKITGAVIVLLIGTGLVAQRMSDGPTGPIPGGQLRTGTLMSEPDVDWSIVLGDKGSCEPGQVCPQMESIELQLVEPLGSRTTGVMVHEGQLYVPCDLGFMWGRFSGRTRLILHTIYIFKRWHEDALLDGRVVLRIAGKRYERQAVRVIDPELLATLRLQLEEMATQWVAPAPLGEAPTEGPRDIWFFRMDPRPAV